MKKRTLWLFFIAFAMVILVLNVAKASANSKTGCYWFKDYRGRIFDPTSATMHVADIAFAPNGDIIVVGDTGSFGAGNLDAWVVRVDKCGKIIWHKSYGGNRDDIGSSVVIAPNGDIIVAGWTGSFTSDGDWDLWMLRLNENGSIIWHKSYGGSIDDGYTPVSLAIDSNGDIVVASTLVMEDGYKDIWVLHLDKNGNVKWEKTYGVSEEDDYANAVSIALDGDIIVAGVTDDVYMVGDNPISGAWVLRLNPDGNIKWQKVYGSYQALELASGLTIDSSGNIIVSGSTGSLSENMYGWLAYLDGNGNVKWSKSYSHKESGNIRELTLAPNGDIIGRDDYILRISPDGNLKWGKWMIDGPMTGPKIFSDGITIIAGFEARAFTIGRFNIDEVPNYSGWNNPDDVDWNGWDDVDIKASDVKLIVVDSNVIPKPFGAPVNDITAETHDASDEVTTTTVWYLCSLTAPQDLEATAGEGNINLSWKPPADDCGCDIIEYKIYRGTSSGNEVYYTSVNGSTLSYTDRNVVNKQTYYYKVSAVNALCEGPKSNEASATASGSVSGGETTSSSETTRPSESSTPASERVSSYKNILIPAIIIVLLVLGVLGYMIYSRKLFI